MNRIAGFVHSQLMLDQRKPGLRDRRRLVESTALSADVAVDLSVTF
jgi:hypothetical protein